MSIIQQGSLFDIQDLYELEPTHRFEAIFSTLYIEPLLVEISKKTTRGAPTELNYAAMIYSLVARPDRGAHSYRERLAKTVKKRFYFSPRLWISFL